MLVVGCGHGEQAAQLAISLDADVTGVERTACFDPAAAAYATLRAGDLSLSPLFRGWRSRLGASFVLARYFIGKRSQSQARAA